MWQAMLQTAPEFSLDAPPRHYDVVDHYGVEENLNNGDTFTEVRAYGDGKHFTEMQVWAFGHWHIPVAARENGPLPDQARDQLIDDVISGDCHCKSHRFA
jgi:hypothetical protein